MVIGAGCDEACRRRRRRSHISMQMLTFDELPPPAIRLLDYGSALFLHAELLRLEPAEPAHLSWGGGVMRR